MEAARPAVAADLPALTALHREATEELRGQRGGVVWAHQSARDSGLTEPSDDPDHLLLAGTIDSVVLGYAAAHVEVLHGGGRLAVLTDVYVDPGARGVGLGEALLDAAVEWAIQRGCTGIDSVALPGMRASKNFFETAGMVARAIIVHRSLEPDG